MKGLKSWSDANEGAYRRMGRGKQSRRVFLVTLDLGYFCDGEGEREKRSAKITDDTREMSTDESR